jgi:uncharacterized caspase-like protein
LLGESGESIRTLAFSPDGKTLATGSDDFDDNVIRLWDISTRTQILTMRVAAPVASLAFNESGDILAMGGHDGFIYLHEVKSGREIKMFGAHSGWVTGLRFVAGGRILVSGSRDGKIKLWEIPSTKEIATLVAVNENDWLVATPDGLFDGSPATWSNILWRFSPNLFDMASVELYFNEFYYPGLLAEIFAGKRPHAQSNIVQKDRRQPQLKLRQVNPPFNEIAASRSITLEVQISEAPAGAKDVRLFRNGSLVKVWHGDVLRGQDSVKLETAIPIIAGANELTVYAFNHDNIKSSDAELTVIGAESLKRTGILYIVAVGVGQNANPNFKLDYAVNDAQAFSNTITAEQQMISRYTKTEVKLLLNDQATKRNLLAELTRLSKLVQPEDGLLIYFSGHGTAQGKRFYMLPYDIGYMGLRTNEAISNGNNLASILRHSISDDELEQVLRTADAGQIVMVIDAGHRGQALHSAAPRRGPMNSTGLAQLAFEKGMYILAASQDAEVAYESAALGHGYLTYVLIEQALKTKTRDVDANKDGQLDLREWFDYAAREVPRLRQQKVEQVIARNPKARAPRSPARPKELNELRVAERARVQTPRAFYRREREAQPFIVAKIAATK